MAVAVVLEWDGGTLQQYDQVNAEMGHPPFGTGPAGLLFHFVTATDTGIRITDVWGTKEGFDAFAADQIMPAVQKAGITTPPSISYSEVHNYLTAAVPAAA